MVPTFKGRLQTRAFLLAATPPLHAELGRLVAEAAAALVDLDMAPDPTGVVDDVLGMSVYMDMEALHALMPGSLTLFTLFSEFGEEDILRVFLLRAQLVDDATVGQDTNAHATVVLERERIDRFALRRHTKL